MMIYDKTGFDQNRCVLFEVDVDNTIIEQIPFGKKVGTWLEGNKTRIAWRLYYFLDSVLREGFVDPILIWSILDEELLKFIREIIELLLQGYCQNVV